MLATTKSSHATLFEPSAYASGALVKCRKVGAANWGNKTKKEEVEINEAGKKCWKGYKKAGTQKLFGKTYNRCVKAEDVELTDAYGETFAVIQDIVKPEPLKKEDKETTELEGTYDIEDMVEKVNIPRKRGHLVNVVFRFRSSSIMLKMFFPQPSLPTRSEVQDQISKVYPGAKLLTFTVSDYELENQSSTQRERHGQKKREKRNQADLTRKEGNLTKEKKSWI